MGKSHTLVSKLLPWWNWKGVLSLMEENQFWCVRVADWLGLLNGEEDQDSKADCRTYSWRFLDIVLITVEKLVFVLVTGVHKLSLLVREVFQRSLSWKLMLWKSIRFWFINNWQGRRRRSSLFFEVRASVIAVNFSAARHCNTVLSKYGEFKYLILVFFLSPYHFFFYSLHRHLTKYNQG